MKLTENEKMILEVARKLPLELLKQVIFLGGAVVGLLVTDKGMGEPRPTHDVDLVVGTNTKTDFQKFESKLRKAGFSPSMEEGAPICRWQIGNGSVDIMPSNEDVLGFSNRWYKAALKHANPVPLEEVEVKIITAPYFLATKIEAFLGRGKNDFLGSSDMEDIVTLFDGRRELVDEIRAENLELQKYLEQTFRTWLQDQVFLSCLTGHSTAGPANRERVEEVKRRIRLVANIGN